MAENKPLPRRNPMMADTDPTDEELAIVMREACELAMQRKATSDEWSRQQLAKAVREARERTLSGSVDGRY